MSFSEIAELVTELPGDIYKFTNMKSFLRELPETKSSSPAKPEDYNLDEVPTLFFVNGMLNNPQLVVPGLEILSLVEKLPPVGVSALANIHQNLQSGGVRITVKQNTKIETPLRILHIINQSGVIAPSVHVEAKENAEFTLIEENIALSHGYALNSESLISVNSGARVEHVHMERGSKHSVHHGTTTALIERDASYRNCVFHISGNLNRRNVYLHLLAPGAHGESFNLYLTGDGEHSDIYTEIHHKAPDSTSDQLAKGILDGASKGIFTGKIHIHPDAQRVNSSQLNKNLLLSKKAQAHSQPQLEIFADDVKCSHGSTTGQLSPEEIFYFESRGIPLERAKTLLANGFGLEVVLKIGNKTTREIISEIVLETLNSKFHLGGNK